MIPLVTRHRCMPWRRSSCGRFRPGGSISPSEGSIPKRGSSKWSQVGRSMCVIILSMLSSSSDVSGKIFSLGLGRRTPNRMNRFSVSEE